MIWQQLDNNQVLKEAIMMKLEQEDRENMLLMEYQMREERRERQKLASMAWKEARTSNNLDKLTKALYEMELQDGDVPEDDYDEDGDSRMTEAEIAESKEEIDSYLNQMLINFECGDLAPSANGTTTPMVMDVQYDDEEDDAMEEETYGVKDDDDKMDDNDTFQRSFVWFSKEGMLSF